MSPGARSRSPGRPGEAVASPGTPGAGGGITLDLSACGIRIGATLARLRRGSVQILLLLHDRRGEAVGARMLAQLLGISSAVDPVSAARAAVTLLRAELRAIGLGGLVASRRTVGYWLAPGYAIEVEGTLPEPPDARRGGRPLRARLLPHVLEGLSDQLAGRPLLSEVVWTRFGLVDAENRSLLVNAVRLDIDDERQFNLLAAILIADGEPVPESRLRQLCNYTSERFGAEMVRRAARQVNALLAARGLPLRVLPASKAYGSPYLAVAGEPAA